MTSKGEIIAQREYYLERPENPSQQELVTLKIYRPIQDGEGIWQCLVEVSGAIDSNVTYPGEDSLQALEQALCYTSVTLWIEDKVTPLRRLGSIGPTVTIPGLGISVPRSPTMIASILATAHAKQ